MKFIITRASDDFRAKPIEKEFKTLEELIDFIREVKNDIILGFEHERVKNHKAIEERGYEIYSDVERIETGNISLTIYDDYIE